MVKSSPSGVTSGEHFEASWGFLATFSQYMASQMKTNIHRLQSLQQKLQFFFNQNR